MKYFLDVSDVNVSTSTIFRRLKAVGLRPRVAAKIDITELHAQQRLIFDHVAEPVEAWDVTIISDEKIFG